MLGIDLDDVSVSASAFEAELREYRRAMASLKAEQGVYLTHLRKALEAADRMAEVDAQWRARPGTFENRLVNELARTGSSGCEVHGKQVIEEVLSIFLSYGNEDK